MKYLLPAEYTKIYGRPGIRYREVGVNYKAAGYMCLAMVWLDDETNQWHRTYADFREEFGYMHEAKQSLIETLTAKGYEILSPEKAKKFGCMF